MDIGKSIINPFRKRDEVKPAAGRIFNEHRYYHDFCALHDVSFELRQGDSIGIIGRNGSGKSTLLQMIAGTLTPTSGMVQTEGRVAALLELGAGFNDEFTGRENVYLNGAILGLSKKDLDERFERIAEFANIGDFMDQPIKTYSSGMRVRLAFAVQAEVDPDILIVDEALAVGDIRFTMKCIRRMKELIENDTTLLFVSHDLGSIVNFCKEVIWIHDGQVIRRGDPKKIALEYTNFMHYGEFNKSDEDDSEEEEESEEEIKTTSVSFSGSDVASLTPLDRADFPKNMIWEDLTSLEWDGNGGVRFLRSSLFVPEKDGSIHLLEGGETLEIFLELQAYKRIEDLIICCDFYDSKGNLIFGINSCFIEPVDRIVEEGDRKHFVFTTTLPYLRNGEYSVLFGASEGNYLEHTHLCGISAALHFKVKSTRLSQNHHVVSVPGEYRLLE